MNTRSRAAGVIIGIGNRVRHDDGIGPAVVEHLAGLEAHADQPDLAVLDGEPARIVELWSGRDLAVVVDAVCAGSKPGTIHRLEVGVDPLPGQKSAASSHTTGLAEAVALATALDRLPSHLVLLGVEPGNLTLGVGLSPPVAAVVEDLARLALEEVEVSRDRSRFETS